MPFGPGKYDQHATRVLTETNAEAVFVAVLGGNKGPGFSVQMLANSEQSAKARLLLLASLLHTIADGIAVDARVGPVPQYEREPCPECGKPQVRQAHEHSEHPGVVKCDACSWVGTR